MRRLADMLVIDCAFEMLRGQDAENRRRHKRVELEREIRGRKRLIEDIGGQLAGKRCCGAK